jgi:hypothetical protein
MPQINYFIFSATLFRERGHPTQHVEEEPVSNVALLDDCVDHLPPNQPEPGSSRKKKFFFFVTDAAEK